MSNPTAATRDSGRWFGFISDYREGQSCTSAGVNNGRMGSNPDQARDITPRRVENNSSRRHIHWKPTVILPGESHDNIQTATASTAKQRCHSTASIAWKNDLSPAPTCVRLLQNELVRAPHRNE